MENCCRRTWASERRVSVWPGHGGGGQRTEPHQRVGEAQGVPIGADRRSLDEIVGLPPGPGAVGVGAAERVGEARGEGLGDERPSRDVARELAQETVEGLAVHGRDSFALSGFRSLTKEAVLALRGRRAASVDAGGGGSGGCGLDGIGLRILAEGLAAELGSGLVLKIVQLVRGQAVALVADPHAGRAPSLHRIALLVNQH